MINPRDYPISTEFAVLRFREEFFFLSSMYPLDVQLNTDLGEVPTVEHSYQMDKFTDPAIRGLIAACEDGFTAKREAKKHEQHKRPDWDDIKLDLMTVKTTEKFLRNPDIAQKLLDTGEKQIIEGNTWDDTYWGVYPPGSCNGFNHLGRILMSIRENLAKQAH